MDTKREAIVIVSLVIFFVILVLGLMGLRNALIKPPALEVSLDTITYTDKENIEIKGKTDKNAKLKLNGKDISVDKDGNFTINEPLNSGENVITFESSNGTKTSTVKKTIVRQSEEKTVAGSDAGQPSSVTTEGATTEGENQVAISEDSLNEAGPAENIIGLFGLTSILFAYNYYRKSKILYKF